MTTIHISTITPILILLLLSQHAQAQTSAPGTTLGAPAPADGRRSRSTILTISINLMIALFFILILCIYFRYYNSNPSRNDRVVPRRVGSIRRSSRAPRGLDIEVIESFPIFEFSAVKSEKIGKGALECAVCLTEFEDDDTLRLIPYCDHVFHPDCIEAWLVGHKTCPVCRCNLADATKGEQAQVNDVVVEVVDEVRGNDSNENEVNNNNNNDSMEQPIRGKMRRSRTMRNFSFGRPRWLGKLARSFSTGHVAAVKQLENMERFTLRLPEKVRMQLLKRRKLEKTTSLVVLPRVSSTRSCYTSRGRFGSVRVDRAGRWGLSLAPPFFTRALSMKSPTVVQPKPTCGQANSLCGLSQENVRIISGEGSLCGAIQAELSQLPI